MPRLGLTLPIWLSATPAMPAIPEPRPKVIASTGYQAGNTAVFVTFDEGVGGNETLFTLVLSRFTTPGTVSGAALNHYALLHTTENILGLPCLLNACTARDMRSAFGLI